MLEGGHDRGLGLVFLHELLLFDLSQLHLLLLNPTRTHARVERTALHDLQLVRPLLLQQDLSRLLLIFYHFLVCSPLSRLFLMPLLYLFLNPLLLEHPLLFDPLPLLILVPFNQLPLTVQVLLVPDLKQLPVIVLVESLELVIQQVPQLVLLNPTRYTIRYLPLPR